jgi:hypothetical protein
VRGCAIDLALPTGVAEAREGEPTDALIAAVDGSSLAAAAAEVVPGERMLRIAWVVAVTQRGARGVWSWMFSRARRLRPIALEDACDALRRAGVVELRVVAIEGSLGLALVHGRLGAAW